MGTTRDNEFLVITSYIRYDNDEDVWVGSMAFSFRGFYPKACFMSSHQMSEIVGVFENFIRECLTTQPQQFIPLPPGAF
jgi:hypothetical protein